MTFSAKYCIDHAGMPLMSIAEPQLIAALLAPAAMDAFIAEMVELFIIIAGIMLATDVFALLDTLGGLMMPNMPFSLYTQSVSVSSLQPKKRSDFPVAGRRAIEESGVSVIDDLREGETLILFARRKSRVRGLVAQLELRRLGHSVVVRAPHEHDSVAGRCVHSKRHVAKDALSRGDNDSVGGTRARTA